MLFRASLRENVGAAEGKFGAVQEAIAVAALCIRLVASNVMTENRPGDWEVIGCAWVILFAKARAILNLPLLRRVLTIVSSIAVERVDVYIPGGKAGDSGLGGIKLLVGCIIYSLNMCYGIIISNY
jgi:hypothetical protein